MKKLFAPKMLLILVAFLIPALSIPEVSNLVSRNSVSKDVLAAGEPLYINAPVTMGDTFSLTSPIFYDKANSAYFLDPAATDNSLTVAGNVGIGTTAPEGILHVWDTANDVSALLVSDGTYIQNTLEVSSPFGIPLTVQGNSYFNGNVGIGTAGPGSKLNVVGTVSVGGGTNTVNNTGNTIELATNTVFGGANDNHTGIRMFAYDMAGWTTAKLGIQVSNNWTTYYGGNAPAKADMAMVIGLSETLIRGNVGIGTTAPLSKLSVGGNGYTNYAIYGNGGVYGTSTYIGVYGYGTTYGVYGASANAGVAGDGGATGVGGSFYGGGPFGLFGNGGAIGVKGYGQSYDFYAAGPGVDYGTSSSIRWKNNIQPINNALEKVLHLNGVYYDWNADHGGKHDMGMIAEDVAKYVPEIVSMDPDAPGYATGMDYGHLTPILVEAIKEQQKQIVSLQNTMNDFISKFKAGLIETKKLIVDGVDVAKKLTELSGRIDKQDQTIRELQTEIQQLKANR